MALRAKSMADILQARKLATTLQARLQSHTAKCVHHPGDRQMACPGHIHDGELYQHLLKDDHIPLDCPPLRVRARGWDWTIEDSNKKEGGKPSSAAFVLYNIRVETAAGRVTYSTKMVYTRWSDIKRLDEALTSGRAYGHTKEMSKILAWGSSMTFWPGSCLKPTTANLRLALIAEYVQAVLQEPQLQENRFVQEFLKTHVPCIRLGTKTTSEAAVSTAQPSGKRITHVITLPPVDPAAGTSTHDPAKIEHIVVQTALAHPSMRAFSIHPSPAPPPQQRRNINCTQVPPPKSIKSNNSNQPKTAGDAIHDIRSWLAGATTLAAAVPFCAAALGLASPPPNPQIEETVMKVFQILLLDSSLLGSYLYGQDLGRLAVVCKEWSPVATQVTGLKPWTGSEPPSAPWRASLTAKMDDVCKNLEVEPRRRRLLLPLCAAVRTAVRKHVDDSKQAVGHEHFIRALETNKMPRLQQLDLSRSHSEMSCFPSLACSSLSRIAASLCNVPNLGELNLADNNIGSEGAVALAKGLLHAPNLYDLDLSNNEIGDKGLVAIASVFKKLPNLEFLQLEGYCLGEFEGSRALARNLHHLRRLKLLSFDCDQHNGMVIAQLDVLQELRLLAVCGDLNQAAAIMLADQLERMPKLRSLCLINNCMSKTSVMIVAAAVGRHPKLQKLFVREGCGDIGHQSLHTHWKLPCPHETQVKEEWDTVDSEPRLQERMVTLVHPDINHAPYEKSTYRHEAELFRQRWCRDE